METKVNVSVDKGIKTLEIRTGAALIEQEPVKLNIDGQIDSVYQFLLLREIDIPKSNLFVCSDTGVITLTIDENNHYFGVVIGRVEFSKKIKDWGLQTAESNFSSPLDLANFLRKRMHHFESRDTAMELIATLRTFRAKVNRIVEAADDGGGNKKALFEQTVESNLPAAFNIDIPIFKDDKSNTRIQLEILIDADSFACNLFSSLLSEQIEKGFEAKVKDQIKLIKELRPKLVIINK